MENNLPYRAGYESGALTYSYPLTLPPGRNGLQPDLQLSYSNQHSAEDVLFGYGWSLNIPFIRRENRSGIEKMASSSSFYSSLSGELATTSATSTYIAKSDDGSFLSYLFSDNRWVVTDKRGTRYTFGSTTAERQDDPADSTRIYKWMLTEVRDTNNDFITYQYYKDAGQIYPSSIIYTGNGATNGVFQIDFTRTSRTDNKQLTALAGFPVKTNYRISEIAASVNGSWARKYALSTGTGVAGNRLLLTGITESGRDAGGGVVTLPAATFSYATTTKGWAQDASWSMPAAVTTDATGFYFIDVNGDALTDVIRSYDFGAGAQYNDVFLNDGDGTWTNSTSTWALPIYLYHGIWSANGAGLADLNGDALPDIYESYVAGTTTINNVWMNTGAGWALSSTTLPLNMDSAYTSTYVLDVNGDGLTDFVRHIAYNPSLIFDDVFINNGDSTWTNSTTTWAVPVDMGWDGTGMADLNGDGLVDVYHSNSGTNTGGPANKVWLSTGHGWTLANDWQMPISFGGNKVAGFGAEIVDVNSDGLADVVNKVWYGETNYHDDVHINNGDGTWRTETDWSVPEYTTKEGVGFSDLNGDGVTDEFQSDLQSNNHVWISNNRATDILIRANLPKGGAYNFAYQATPRYKDASNQLLNPKLPYLLQTLSAAGFDDGLGLRATTTYSYHGGVNHYESASNHRLGGFAKIVQTDSDRTITTYFHQGNTSSTTLGEYSDSYGKIGKPYRVETASTAGTLYHLAITKWDEATTSGSATFPFLAQTVELSYDGLGTHRDRATSYTYSSTTGNLTEKKEWGEVTGATDGTFSDTGTDSRTTTISYALSGGSSVKNAPYDEVTVDHSATQVKQTRHYYDNLALGSVSLGNETKTEEWKDGTSYASTTRTYNSYGLVMQSKDARGNTATSTYDPYNLYVATTTNALSQSTTYSYDYASGKVATTTDSNGLVTSTVHDGLGRPVLVKQPDLTTPSTLVTKSSFTYVDNTLPTSVRRTDHLNSATSTDAYQYFDGLGRIIQERKTAEAANTFVARDTAYGLNSLTSSESLPYFSTGSSYTSPTTTASLFTTYTYDALRRPTTIATAVGTTTNAYTPWKVTTTDPNGSVHDYLKDAFENLVQVNEYLATSTYSTTYTYDVLNNLTKITDALGNIRNFTYDGRSRRLSAQDLHAPADGTFGAWSYSYDDAGNLTQTVDPKTQTIYYTYDALNRVATEDYTGSSGTEVTYTYDSCTYGKLRLCIASSTAARYQFTYNPLGSKATDTVTIIGTTTSFATGYTVDRHGNETLITYPDNTQVRYVYNAAGLIDSIQAKESGSNFTNILTNVDYAPTWLPTTLQLANGVTTVNTYNPAALYRLTSKVSTLPNAQKAQDLTYTYDAVGNITRIVDASTVATAKTMDYTYDALSRLVTASSSAATSSQDFKHAFSYDALGSILSGPAGTYSYAGTGYTNPHAVTSISSGGGGASTSTPTYIQSVLDRSTGSATLPSSVTAGNTVIVGVTAWGTVPIPSDAISDNKGNTYTKLGEAVNGDDRAAIFYAKNVTGGSSFTVYCSINNTFSVHEYSGIATSSPVDKVATSTGSSNTPTTGPVTTTVGNELAFGVAWSMAHNDSWTAGSGYTKRQEQIDNNSYERHASEDRVLTTATTTSATFTTGTSDEWAMALATFKPLVTQGGGGSATTYTYDNNGNLAAASPWTYAWDYRNRLTSAGTGAATSTYSYDHTENRVKTVEGSQTTFFPNKYFSTSGATNTKHIFAFGLPVATIDRTPGSPSGPSTSTPAIIQSAVATSGVVTLPNSVTAGNLVTVALSVWSTTAIPTNAITDNKGNTYTRVNEIGNGDDHIAIFYAKNVTGGSSFTITSSKGGTISAHEYSGVATSSPLDKNNKAVGTGTALSSGSVTTTLDNELYFGAAWSMNTNDTWTAGTGYTLRTQVIDNDWVERHASEDKVVSTGTSTAATFTVSTSGAWAASLATFKPLVSASSGSSATSAVRFILADHLGSTQVVTSSTGTVVQTLDYYPYGVTRLDSKVGTYAGAQREYIGEYGDATGLSYLNARYYDGGRGQFLSQDPVFWEISRTREGLVVLSNPQQLNSYGYANANPVTSKDPNGRFASSAAFAPLIPEIAVTAPAWLPPVIAIGSVAAAVYIASQYYPAPGVDYQTGQLVTQNAYLNGLPDGSIRPPHGKWGPTIATIGVSIGLIDVAQSLMEKADSIANTAEAFRNSQMPRPQIVKQFPAGYPEACRDSCMPTESIAAPRTTTTGQQTSLVEGTNLPQMAQTNAELRKPQSTCGVICK
nr:SpvB/TcaC N-terminal domain-containing protein [Methylocystis sp. WRRC1]